MNKFDEFFERLCSISNIKNQSDLSRALDVGRAAISLAKKKGVVPSRWILTLSSNFALNPLWLENGIGECRFEDNESDFVYIPKVAARLSAGGGSFLTENNIESYYSFERTWIEKKGASKNMVLMGIVGNSMEPELHEGDTVLVNQNITNILSGAIYAVGIEDTVLVKRVEKLPQKIVLHSDNSEYTPIVLQGEEINSIRIIGKIIWTAREYF